MTSSKFSSRPLCTSTKKLFQTPSYLRACSKFYKYKKLKSDKRAQKRGLYNKVNSFGFIDIEELGPVSVGRFVSTLISQLKKKEWLDSPVVYLMNVESLFFVGRKTYIVEKYRKKYNAGNRNKGPFFERSPKGLFDIVLRGMLKYKKKHKVLYEKIVCLNKVKTMELKKFLKDKNVTYTSPLYSTKLIKAENTNVKGPKNQNINYRKVALKLNSLTGPTLESNNCTNDNEESIIGRLISQKYSLSELTKFLFKNKKWT